mmetsp:Transcript_2837/g.5910  ORF Transcript_2837/g.5910 Transcript_2837/m.5910 type:complete len:249 (-) Transcript_2837:728-1474(-)
MCQLVTSLIFKMKSISMTNNKAFIVITGFSKKTSEASRRASLGTTSRISKNARNVCNRPLSTSTASPPVGVPSRTTSWERSASLVKNTDVKGDYVEHIRNIHDPSQHIKTLEEEIMGAMGQALGKQDVKVAAAINAMEKELNLYTSLVNEDADGKESASANESARRYNRLREDAKKLRWELLVHRQAIGFTVQNHKVVHDMYPIGDSLSVMEAGESTLLSRETAKGTGDGKKVFGDQLDWWENIGRWK